MLILNGLYYYSIFTGLSALSWSVAVLESYPSVFPLPGSHSRTLPEELRNGEERREERRREEMGFKGVLPLLGQAAEIKT